MIDLRWPTPNEWGLIALAFVVFFILLFMILSLFDHR